MPPESSSEIARQKPTAAVAILMGLLTFTCGAVVLAAATGMLATQPGTLEAPRWVIGCAGIVFMAGALVPLNAAFGFPNWLNQLAGLSIAAGLALVFNWVAFFPGERHFSSTLSLPGVQLSSGGGQIEGRIMFGLGALLADAIVLWGLWRLLRPVHPPAQRDARGCKT
jgi:hypothetical protein